MSTQHQIVEHIVLLKFKADADFSKVAAMIDEVNVLSSDLIIHHSAGELIRCKSTSLNFTHVLHYCFRTNKDLQVYFADPVHWRMAADIKPIIEDTMIVDWISNCITDLPKPGSAMRVILLKLKQDLVENEKSKLMDQLMEGKNMFKLVEHVRFGEIFSHDKAKGYSISIIVFFPGIADLEALDSNAELVNNFKVKAKDFVESELVVDYVFPPPKVANV